MKEIWKDIKGYENKYQISNYGNVRSLISNQVLTCRYNHSCRYIILYDQNSKRHSLSVNKLLDINTNTKVETLYNSITEASNQLGIHPSTISNILHNRIKSCKEYCFKFVIDNKEII